MKKYALISKIEKVDDTSLKIILNDLIQVTDMNWKEDLTYTFKEYDIESFEQLQFDDKELADFGYSIIARLYAFYKQNEI